MKKILFISLLTAITLLPFACNPKEEIAPENPCAGQEEVKADFVIEEGQFDKNWPIVFNELDSVTFAPVTLRYRVLTPNIDSCRWFLGSEQITQKQFFRGMYPEASKIDVTLVVYKHYKLGCTRNFKTSDTLTKSFYTYPIDSLFSSTRYWTLFGTYEGYKKSNPSKVIQVDIGFLPSTEQNSSDGSFITNIPYDGYVSKKYKVNVGGFKEYAFNAVGAFGSSIFSLYSPHCMYGLPNDKRSIGVKVKNNLKLTYYYFKDTLANGEGDTKSPILYDEFIGKKIK